MTDIERRVADETISELLTEVTYAHRLLDEWDVVPRNASLVRRIEELQMMSYARGLAQT